MSSTPAEQEQIDLLLEAFRKKYGRDPNGLEKLMLISAVKGLL